MSNTTLLKKIQKKSHNFEHLVQFYRDEDILMELLSSYFKLGISNGDSFIVIATKEHLQAIKAHLGQLIDVDKAITTKKYIPLDAAETLEEFMVNGMPDSKKFAKLAGNLIDRTALRGGRVRAFGEMVALLWHEGNQKAAIKLEKLWNGLADSRDFSLLCSYPISDFHNADHKMPFPQICTLHSAVIEGQKIPA